MIFVLFVEYDRSSQKYFKKLYIYISNDSCHSIRIFILGCVWQHVKYFQVKIFVGKENIFKCLAVL